MTRAVVADTQEQVGAQVRTALAEKLRIEPETIRGDDKLQELPGADSVRLLQVVAQIERRWGLELEDAEIFRPHTFDGLVELVWSYVERLPKNDA
jgi:acyl carrier protein